MVWCERSCQKGYTVMWNMKALSVRVYKLWPRLKFLRSRSNFKVTSSKIMVWCERSCHKKYPCELWKSYLLLFISYWPRLKFLSADNDAGAMIIVLRTFVTANYKVILSIKCTVKVTNFDVPFEGITYSGVYMPYKKSLSWSNRYVN